MSWLAKDYKVFTIKGDGWVTMVIAKSFSLCDDALTLILHDGRTRFFFGVTNLVVR